MALHLPQWQKVMLGLSDAQVEHLRSKGVTSLQISVQALVPRSVAAAMGYNTTSSRGGNFPVGLARVLDPNGRKGAGVYDHVDQIQVNFRPENLNHITQAANVAKARRPERQGKRKLRNVEEQLP